MFVDQKSEFCQNVGSSHFIAASYFVNSDILVYSSFGEAEAEEHMLSAEGKQLPELLQLGLRTAPESRQITAKDHSGREAQKSNRESKMQNFTISRKKTTWGEFRISQVSDDSFNKTLKAWYTKEKMDKLYFIKI